jgi:glycerophosphoryl diester phosphodiesterase
MKFPLIVAHRGASAHAPENTLAAFRSAIDVGAEGVEFDVRLSKDGIPVVIHDGDLRRTGNRSEKVSELTCKELGKVDVGSWFNRRFRARARAEFAFETVPTLQQTLSLLKDFNGPICIELKANAETFRGLSAAVCDVIRDSPLLPQIIIKSFKLASIPQVKHLIPDVQTAALFALDVMLVIRHREHVVTLASEFGADRISVHHSLVSPRLAQRAADVGMPVIVWTVDDPRWLSRRRNLNIDALITNDPKKFLGAK